MDEKATKTEALVPADAVLTIGEVAKLYGLTLRALRFYEDRGLLQPIREGSTRLYDASARQRLTLILKGKQLGFTLTEIRDLIQREGDSGQIPDLPLAEEQIIAQLDLLQRQRDDLERAIDELQARRNRLPSVSDIASPA
jgi:DNA-binding transcriptional MerR regulator